MIEADDKFLEDRELPMGERELAIRWVCRIFGVFAEEACRLARVRAPGWSPLQIETKTEEVLELLLREAESSKGLYNLSLTNSTLSEISSSPEWLTYRSAMKSLLADDHGLQAQQQEPPLGSERAKPVGSTMAPTPPPGQPAKSRNPRGPRPDYETALKVRAIVEKTVPQGDWRRRGHLNEICEVLDEEIQAPVAWQTAADEDYPITWSEKLAGGARSRHIVVEAIAYRLKMAKRVGK